MGDSKAVPGQVIPLVGLPCGLLLLDVPKIPPQGDFQTASTSEPWTISTDSFQFQFDYLLDV